VTGSWLAPASLRDLAIRRDLASLPRVAGRGRVAARAHHGGDGADDRLEDDARAAWAGGRAEAGGGDCRATSDRARPAVERGVGFTGVFADGDGGSAGVAGAGVGDVAALVAFGAVFGG
jgi:hypothetical protein